MIKLILGSLTMFSLLFLASCSSKVSQGDCEKAFQHMTDLVLNEMKLDAEAAKKQRAELQEMMKKEAFLQQCTKYSKSEEISCILQAQKRADTAKCGMKVQTAQQ